MTINPSTTTYELRARSIKEPIRTSVSSEKSAQDAFAETLERHGIEEGQADSFISTGAWRTGPDGASRVWMSGDELILSVRGLPKLSVGAWSYLSSELAETAGLYCDPTRETIADWVRPVIDELMLNGLIAQGEGEFGPGYFLTEEGRAYPRRSVTFSTRAILVGLKPVVPLEPVASPSDNAPEM